LNIKLGDKIIIYFVQNPIRFRKLKVTAIYNTNLQDFDKLFCFVSMPLLQKINHWNKNEVNGYEILTEKKESQQEIRENIDKVINGPIYSSKEKLQNLKLVSVQDKYPQLFFWLSLLHSNVLIIIILMLFVSAINLISALLIIIIENINKIGLLKAFGATNKEIRQIFLYYSIYLTVKGVLIGNLLALFLVWLQYQYHIIPLNAEHYYMSYVPVHFDWIALFWINIISIPLIIIILTVPTHYIAKISPVKVIRFQ
jgi:lipoprotein-releasing system permease protein